MTIPLPKKYMQAELGRGKLANYQNTQADTRIAAEKISYGAPVEALENKVSVLSDGKFFGVAIAENFTAEIPYDNGEKIGEYQINQPISVLRKGSVWVNAVEDVKESEPAAATAEGFKKASEDDEIVGIFQTTAQENNLVILQINLP